MRIHEQTHINVAFALYAKQRNNLGFDFTVKYLAKVLLT